MASHALRVAMEQAGAMSSALSDLEALDDPGARLELSRELRDRAAQLHREAELLEALAMGLSIGASAEVDAGRELAPEGED